MRFSTAGIDSGTEITHFSDASAIMRKITIKKVLHIGGVLLPLYRSFCADVMAFEQAGFSMALESDSMAAALAGAELRPMPAAEAGWRIESTETAAGFSREVMLSMTGSWPRGSGSRAAQTRTRAGQPMALAADGGCSVQNLPAPEVQHLAQAAGVDAKGLA